MFNHRKKGVILFIVLGVIILTILLATVILRIISNQSRLTHHQVSRIQAQYAAKAGVLYALDKLRRNDDAATVACLVGTGIIMRKSGPDPCVVIEPDLPNSIQNVAITVGALGSGPSGTRKVSATADYIY